MLLSSARDVPHLETCDRWLVKDAATVPYGVEPRPLAWPRQKFKLEPQKPGNPTRSPSEWSLPQLQGAPGQAFFFIRKTAGRLKDP